MFENELASEGDRVNRVPLACADFSFPLLDHNLALTLIAGMKIEGVDVSLMFGNAHLDVQECLEKPEVEGRLLSNRVQAHGLRIADVNFTPGRDFRERALNHPEPAERELSREWYRRALGFAAEAGSPHMTLLPGIHWESEDLRSSVLRAAEELNIRLEEAAKADVLVSIEAHLGSIVPTPQLAREFLGSVPGLSLTLDYTHFVYQGFTNEECDALLPLASHFHARGGRKGRLQTPLKDSAIEYGRVLQTMKQVGYRGYFAIEYVWIDWEHCNETDNVSETILLRNLANEVR